MADEKELNPSPKFPTGVKPELSPNPNFSDGLENKTDEKPNTQIVNESKPQPIKNLTTQQIIELIQKYAPGFDPSSVEAGELVSALGLNSDGVLKKQALAGLFDGKYVRIMNAPSSEYLTEEEVEIFGEGVFINGSFKGMKNPVFFPFKLHQTTYYGTVIGVSTTSNEGVIIAGYTISQSTRRLLISNIGIKQQSGHDKWILNYIESFNGKNIPNYSGDSVISHFICRKGTLQWYIPVAQDNITSGDVIATTSDLGKALIDHLDVEINGFRARYEYTSGNYVVYSSKSEVDSGAKLQINMISYNTTNGELSFNQMTFTPDN